MKTSSTRIALYRLLIFVILLLYSVLVFSQIDPNTTILPARSLIQLSATDKKQEGVELNGVLMASHTYDKIIFERKTESEAFQAIAERPLTDNSTIYSFKYIDSRPGNAANYYRVRLVNTIHNLQEISTILLIRRDDKVITELKILNTILQSNNPTISLSSLAEKEVSIEVTDMSGQRVSAAKIALNHGSSQCYLPNLTGRSGYFAVVLRTQNKITKQTIIIQ